MRPDPRLPPTLVEQILLRLGLPGPPSLDLPGLNALFAAYCGSIPFDNIRKRIWFAGDRRGPLPGGEPTDFFEHWIAHGTGGTCWPINGGLCTLLRAVGFELRRIAGQMIFPGSQPTNHGSVLVTLDGTPCLVDANIGSFRVLPLVSGTSTSTGHGIHDITAVPVETGFEVVWYTGHNRGQPIPFRPEPEHDPVDHAFFLGRYDGSTSSDISPFNQSLYVCRRYPDSILTVGRHKKIVVAADGSMTTTEITDAERTVVLIKTLGFSEEIVAALPPDVPGGVAFV